MGNSGHWHGPKIGLTSGTGCVHLNSPSPNALGLSSDATRMLSAQLRDGSLRNVETPPKPALWPLHQLGGPVVGRVYFDYSRPVGRGVTQKRAAHVRQIFITFDGQEPLSKLGQRYTPAAIGSWNSRGLVTSCYSAPVLKISPRQSYCCRRCEGVRECAPSIRYPYVKPRNPQYRDNPPRAGAEGIIGNLEESWTDERRRQYMEKELPSLAQPIWPDAISVSLRERIQ